MRRSTLCNLCGEAEASVHLRDELSAPPRDLRLCAACAEVERGRASWEALRLSGVELGSEPPSEGELRSLARQISALKEGPADPSPRRGSRGRR
jgi:hypothetical protein